MTVRDSATLARRVSEGPSLTRRASVLPNYAADIDRAFCPACEKPGQFLPVAPYCSSVPIVRADSCHDCLCLHQRLEPRMLAMTKWRTALTLIVLAAATGAVRAQSGDLPPEYGAVPVPYD